MEKITCKFYQGDELIRKVAFTGNNHVTIAIGKGQADVNFTLDEVSRNHAQLVYDGADLFIKDCGSTNGTFVNSKRIANNELTKITANDRISFSGSDKARLQIGDGAKVEGTNGPVETVGSIVQHLNSKNEVTIGRGADCDVVLQHSSVSRVHATISKSGEGRYKLVDKGSLNGTFVNGKRIHSTEVTASDNIFIGRFQISLKGETRNLSNEPAVTAKRVTKVYGKKNIALNETTFDIPSGGLVAIMGPSGCGKSTLLKVLNGDSPASAGAVHIHGLELIGNYGYLKTQIGYVPQDDIVHRELTVEQSLYYSAKIRLDGAPDEMIREKIEQILRDLNIVAIRNNLVSAISGGQRKRVAIGVELLSDPAVLFLDEPTSPLDPQTIEEFMGILRRLAAKGTTVIMVTHKPDDLHHMDSVMFLAEGGNLVYYGSAQGYKEYFNVSAPVEVYANIAGEKAAFWVSKNKDSHAAKLDNPAQPRKVDSKVNWFTQLYWLSRRYLKIKTNDQLNSVIMLAQAPIIACLICLIFGDIRLSVPFLMAVSAIWFGVNNAAREIVAEAAIYKRERMFNVLITPYIFSKVAVLGLFALAQAAMFNLIIWIGYSGDSLEWNNPVMTTLWMFVITIAATLFGLLISAGASSTEKVMSVVPIAVIPQIMLAGIVARIPNSGVEFLSYFTFSRWGTEGFSHFQGEIVDISPKVDQAMLATDPSHAVAMRDTVMNAFTVLGRNFHVSYTQTFGSSAGTPSLDLIVVSILSLLCLAGTWISLKNKDSI